MEFTTTTCNDSFLKVFTGMLKLKLQSLNLPPFKDNFNYGFIHVHDKYLELGFILFKYTYNDHLIESEMITPISFSRKNIIKLINSVLNFAFCKYVTKMVVKLRETTNNEIFDCYTRLGFKQVCTVYDESLKEDVISLIREFSY